MAQNKLPSQKKVLFLITKATWGGAQKYVYDLATHIPREEFAPVVAYGAAGKLSEDLARANITTYQVPSLGRDVSAFADLASFLKILKGLRKGRPDVVHLNSSKAAALGALAARIAGVPRIIFTVHGWPFGEQRNPLSRAIIFLVSWLTALLSHKVIAVSEYDLKAAHRMPLVAHKTVRIYNGIALESSLGSGEVIRRAFPEGVRITGTVGELTRNKNQIALIEEARGNPELYVAIVGDGEDRAYLQSKIEAYGLQARVKLFGFMSASTVLGGFDVFALPSIKEGLPYVLLEAKAAGLPIVANRVGGVGEILDAKDMTEFSLERMVEHTAALYR